MLGPDGFPLWVSQAEPGSVHDMTAARIHALPPSLVARFCRIPAAPHLSEAGPPACAVG